MGNLRVVLLAAGDSRRFKSYGFTGPKSNLTVRPTPTSSIQSMLSVNAHGLERALKDVLTSTILVCKSDVGVPRFESPYNTTRVTITQQGAASSAILASAYIEPYDSVILVDTDNFLTDYSITRNIAMEMEAFKSQGSIAFGSLIAIPRDPSWFDPVPLMMTPSDPLVKPSDLKQIQLYSRPFSPEDQELRGSAANENAINIGIYFVSEWRRFREAYCEEVLYRFQGVDGKDSNSEISVLDVLQTMEVRFKERAMFPEIEVSSWKPCGTPDQYIINRGY